MPMTDLTPHALRVADLPQSRASTFDITLKGAELEQLRTELDLSELRKVRFFGEIQPLGKRDWQLTGELGATVVQPCVATLAPVTTRVDTNVTRQFLSNFTDPDESEAEMPEDDETEALGTHIDPGAVLAEALSLAIPNFPRADGVEPVEIAVTEPGQKPMTDDDVKPFAGLAELRAKMGGGDPE